MYNARIILLNYNGEKLLPLCLPSIVAANRQAAGMAPVTVLDNCSTDGSEAYVRQHFPEVEFVPAAENRVLCSYNGYAATIQEPLMIFLNNDIRVADNFLEALLIPFARNPKTFLVAPKVMNFDGTRIDAARTKSGFRFGFFWTDARWPGYEKEADTPSETFASGFGAFSREKFLALGGYDERFLPGIMEDADICLRARRAGFELLYAPQSIVYHMGQESFRRKYGSFKIACLAQRNNFLFMWKNFGGLGFWIPHAFFLPLRLLFALLKGNLAMVVGFSQALKKQCRLN